MGSKCKIGSMRTQAQGKVKGPGINGLGRKRRNDYKKQRKLEK
jgi:hypothetical protein